MSAGARNVEGRLPSEQRIPLHSSPVGHIRPGVGGPRDLPYPHQCDRERAAVQAQQIAPCNTWSLCVLALGDAAGKDPTLFGDSTSAEDEATKRARIQAQPRDMVEALRSLPLWVLAGAAYEHRLDVEPLADLVDRLLAHIRAVGLRTPAPLARPRRFEGANFLR
jgi:hypothetical protein